ncbi:SGNH/GDSL hydrolase family protein [Sorangium sp. So ce1036]|uniref:SGNH/GDSL hydrolase family protein n=1 Tax=Sorangium sp. So ce1036 TaxID=3133328 RepID=UPI003F02EEE1
MLVHRLKFSSSAVLACVVLLVAACGEGDDSPGTTTGGTASTASSGTTSGSGTAAGGGGSPGSSGSSATSGGGAADGGAGGTAGGGTGGAGGAGSGGMGGVGGMGGASDGVGGTAGDGGAAGGSAGASGGPAFQPCPESGPCKIMPFGDSITQGFNVAGGYRAPLFHLALEANRDITFVGSASDYSVPMVDGVPFPRNHEGHGGWTIEGNNGIAKLVDTSIPNYQPNIITLMIGTNDINGNINVADAPNRLGKLLDSIFMRDPNILVVLAQIVPSRTDGTNNAIKAYNAAMPDLVSTRVGKGQHIVLVDMYTAFTDDTNYKQSLLADNLHPNQAGYNRMAEVWFQALSPYLR